MLKRIYEELVSIRCGINEICEYLKPLKEKDSGITIKTFLPNLSIQPTVVSFELNYHDWLKLEKSKEWKSFQKLLLECQKEYNRKSL